MYFCGYAAQKKQTVRVAGSIFATYALWLQSKHRHGGLRIFKGVSVEGLRSSSTTCGSMLNKWWMLQMCVCISWLF